MPRNKKNKNKNVPPPNIPGMGPRPVESPEPPEPTPASPPPPPAAGDNGNQSHQQSPVNPPGRIGHQGQGQGGPPLFSQRQQDHQHQPVKTTQHRQASIFIFIRN